MLYRFIKNFSVFLIEFLKGAVVQRLADALHQAVVEVQVVGDGQAHTQRLLGFDEVANVGAAVIPTRGAIAGQTDGARILHVLLVEQIDLALPGEQVELTGLGSAGSRPAAAGGKAQKQDDGRKVPCLRREWLLRARLLQYAILAPGLHGGIRVALFRRCRASSEAKYDDVQALLARI